MPTRKKTTKRAMPGKKGAAPAVRVPTAKIANMHSRYFDVRQSGIQGKGAFATRKIRKGQRIIEYAGERISNDEADNRYDESAMRRHHTFLFTVTPRRCERPSSVPTSSAKRSRSASGTSRSSTRTVF